MNPFYKHLTSENHTQQAVIEYLKLKRCLFVHPMSEGRKSPFERYLAKYLGIEPGWSDLLILVPNQKYHGLMIELKADGVTVFKKDGTIRKNETLEHQYKFILECRANGYYADFAIGSNKAIELIDRYMNNEL